MEYHISSGVTSSGIALYNGRMCVSSGGTANDTTVNFSGYVNVFSGGTANNTAINSRGAMCIHSGGMANNTTVNYAGDVYIISGGVANNTTVNYLGYICIDSGGVTNDTTVNSGTMYIRSGGVANSTTVNFDGFMHVSSGAVANSTTVNSYGFMYISSGGTATAIKENGGYVYVYNGANVTFVSNTISGLTLSGQRMTVHKNTVASSTTISSGGRMYISSGGVANNTTVNDWGDMYISSGGVANSTTLSGYSATMRIYSGGTANSTTVYSRGSMYISSGGTANSTTVNYLGEMSISSGGTASNTIVSSGGNMKISSGGTANSTTVNSGGFMHISSGGVANSTNVNSDGYIYVFSGGVENHATVYLNGNMYISSGGTANSTTVNSGGSMNISSGGTAKAIKENGGYVKVADGADVSFASNTISGLTLSGRSMTLHQNTVANSTNVNRMGSMYISSGGTANCTTVNSNGHVYISSGGIANNTTVNFCGNMYISSGGTASNTVNSSGHIYIFSGGTADSTTVNSWGSMHISSGGVANNTIVNSNGSMFISSGGTATAIKENGGYVGTEDEANVSFVSNTINGRTVVNGMTIHKNTVANSTTVNFGSMYIYSGGVANSTTVNSICRMYIYSGGTATAIKENGGYVEVADGASVNFVSNTINGRTILHGNAATIHQNTVANNTVISGGSMYIYSGGIHRGSLHITYGAVVSAYEGSQIDFTVAGRTTSHGYLISNLHMVSGTPTYTITVSASQAAGTYKLAQWAENFNSTISIGDGTTDYGSITVNGDDLVYNGITYSLDKADGNLTLTVSGISNLQATANGATWNGNAETVEYSQNSFATVLKLNTSGTAVDTYQTPAGSWQVRVDSDVQTSFTAAAPTGSAAQVVSDADGNLDVFFARTAGTWTSRHAARHAAPLNGWRGTNERVALTGKNIITDVFAGSSDANVLVLTDDSNGDALFLDDAFTALGNQARLSHIDEIRAGAGNDVIDLTSPKFAYLGDEMTVFGGNGDDTIWANSGENTLYGDAGNDRIIGGAGNDFIIGGAGNDKLHGGGGSDTFCFGANWGADTVEQLATGKVILCFETGSMSNWNATTKTYTSGNNTVTVTGSGDIELYFGTASTLPQDAFAPASSEKIFEPLA